MDVYVKLEKRSLLCLNCHIRWNLKQVGSMLFVSWQGATIKGVPCIVGKIGSERTIEEGQQAAKIFV